MGRSDSADQQPVPLTIRLRHGRLIDMRLAKMGESVQRIILVVLRSVAVIDELRPFSVSWNRQTPLATDAAPAMEPPLFAVTAAAVAWPPNCQPSLMNEFMALWVSKTKMLRNFSTPKPSPACSSTIFM